MGYGAGTIWLRPATQFSPKLPFTDFDLEVSAEQAGSVYFRGAEGRHYVKIRATGPSAPQAVFLEGAGVRGVGKAVERQATVPGAPPWANQTLTLAIDQTALGSLKMAPHRPDAVDDGGVPAGKSSGQASDPFSSEAGCPPMAFQRRTLKRGRIRKAVDLNWRSSFEERSHRRRSPAFSMRNQQIGSIPAGVTR